MDRRESRRQGTGGPLNAVYPRCNIILLGVFFIALIGCGKSPTPLPEVAGDVPVSPPLPGIAYRVETTGTLAGRVKWSGPVPIRGQSTGAVPKGEGYAMKAYPVAFAVRVDSKTHGLADVLVTVKVAEPERWKAWPHPAARIVARDFRLTAFQGEREMSGPLIVRRGESLSIASAEDELHVFRGRGVAFFSLTFPKAMIRTVEMNRSGIAEITSGAGYHWLAHDVAVSDHPYLAVTDDQGRFSLDGLPAGTYEVSFRLRDPTILNRERDPETGLWFRTNHAPAVVKTIQAVVAVDRVAEATVHYDGNDLNQTESQR